MKSYHLGAVSDVPREFGNQSFEFFKADAKSPILARIIGLPST